MNRKLIGTVLTLTFVPWTLGFATTKYLEWSVALTSDQEITEMEAVDAPQEEGRRKNKSTKSTSTLSEDSYVRSIINRSIFDSSKVNEKLTTKPDINPEDGVFCCFLTIVLSVVLTYHGTWLINSAAHTIGNRLIKKMTMVYAELIQKFSQLHTMQQYEFSGLLYRQKDFNEEACRKLYDQMNNGLIENYLNYRKPKINIITNPGMTE